MEVKVVGGIGVEEGVVNRNGRTYRGCRDCGRNSERCKFFWEYVVGIWMFGMAPGRDDTCGGRARRRWMKVLRECRECVGWGCSCHGVLTDDDCWHPLGTICVMGEREEEEDDDGIMGDDTGRA